MEGVGQVINFDLSDSELRFTHRARRTGRMGRYGEAVTFVTPDEERKWRETDRGLGGQFVRKPWRASLCEGHRLERIVEQRRQLSGVLA